MIDAEQEVALAKQEESAFFHSKGAPSCLPTYGTVPLFSSSAESATDIDCLPTSQAATWPDLPLTFAPLLTQPEAHGHLRPICCKGRRQGWIEAADTLITLPYHLLF